ncbi:phosphoglucosamine mutase [Caldicellulosiruptor morganii]|uniref:Phosphoglucosamine mutase n=1 Tax=Caldicellulosiruptor morganii TaxID=1387555 RepID=A0ABY7BN62_9FIRM|nr:phosphoglucosamine mutase [Caldicellulosiruptor morganii]WAM34283.1 phosphoglucosamine mutase [Caldicellulosiruptor morganii]
MGRLFGTDGVRGIANKELTCELAFDLGRAGAYVLTEPGKKPKILIGKDTRISCDMLEAALCAGLTSVGADVYLAGVVTTPAIAHLVKSHRFDAGIMISASHNPYEFNGIKFFNSQGFKLSDRIEERIEDIILNKKWDEVPHAQFDAIGRVNKAELENDYKGYLKSTLNGASFKGLKIVMDCANGAAYKIAPTVFEELGAEVLVINNQPDGTNINKECGSTHLEMLKQEVVKNRADFGIAYDGDADRTLFVDENGEVVDGDKIMLLLAKALKDEGKLKNNTLVVTVMSNMGLFVAAKELGINLEVTKVGDRYVLEKMLEGGYSIGGEQSGHIILLDYATTGDGILTSLHLTKLIVNTNKKLSELAKIMKVYPQVLVNARVENSKKELYKEDSVIMDAISALEHKFNGKGRVLIRPSGTEPLIRVMIEGEDYEEIKKDAEALAKLIESRLS